MEGRETVSLSHARVIASRPIGFDQRPVNWPISNGWLGDACWIERWVFKTASQQTTTSFFPALVNCRLLNFLVVLQKKQKRYSPGPAQVRRQSIILLFNYIAHL